MNIETITIPHPNLNKRNITLLLVDGKADIPSTEFLIYEARYGGRNNGVGGKTSHSGKAFQIAELYKHLDSMGLNWDTATESDIREIRNDMLCWNSSNKEDSSVDNESIRNDTMNHKLNTWFKFYKHMNKIGISNDMVLTTRKVKAFKKKGMLDHLNKRFGKNESDMIDTWTLKVKSSPTSHTYHALTRTEFSILRQHLRNEDIIYEMIALLMVETGLRIEAALGAKETDFRSWLKLISSGKSIDDTVKMNYIPKGGDEPYKCDLPIRTINEINKNYLIRIYPDRLYEYEKRCERYLEPVKEDILWINSNGKEIKRHDIWGAFRKASDLMGRKNNNITPHWMRHTMATWYIIDIASAKGIPLENTGTTPNPLFILALQEKLGHADASTTMKYIATALKIMGLDLNSGPIKISLRDYKRNKASQELVKREAMNEFKEDFNEKLFDSIKYALSREIVVDDELL